MTLLSLVHSFQGFLSSFLAALHTQFLCYIPFTLLPIHMFCVCGCQFLKPLCPTRWSSEPALSHRQAAFLITHSRQAKQAHSLVGFAILLFQQTLIPSVPVGKSR